MVWYVIAFIATTGGRAIVAYVGIDELSIRARLNGALSSSASTGGNHIGAAQRVDVLVEPVSAVPQPRVYGVRLLYFSVVLTDGQARNQVRVARIRIQKRPSTVVS